MLKGLSLGGDCQMAGGAALVADVVFSGNRNGEMVSADLKSGAVIWRNSDGEGELFTTPAVTEDRVVFSSGDGKVVCVERATGKKVWIFDADGNDLTSPVIAKDKVVVANGGALLVLSLADGAKIWSRQASDVAGNPILVGNMIVVGTVDGKVMAFGESKGVAK
jgi:outer membrane protein assembly factor BamB